MSLFSKILILVGCVWLSSALIKSRMPTNSNRLITSINRNYNKVTDTTPLFMNPTSRDELTFEDYFNRPGPWDDPNLNPLFEGNQNWIKRVKEQNLNTFTELRKGHAPKILWIGCADARVPANEIIGEPAGSVFVHRNIANMVVNTDFNCMSVIQYAVDVLKVKHIIVCGHYDCGGVKASMERRDHRSPLENWLRNIRDIYRLHKEELVAIPGITRRTRRLVELNVVEQCLNVFKTAVVQRRRVETWTAQGKEGNTYTFTEPRIHAMVYEPTTGELTRLPVDFKEIMKDLREVYDLYLPDVEIGQEKNV